MGKQGIVKEGVLITCAMLIVSAAVYFFLVPSKIVVGSISGLAMVLAELLHMQMSTITFILNVVLLMAGFLFIGKEFGAKTIYTSLLLPVFLWIFERLFPVTESLTGNSVYDLVSYILIIALGQAILTLRQEVWTSSQRSSASIPERILERRSPLRAWLRQ